MLRNDILRLCVVTLSHAGGEGKTWLAMLFRVILNLLDQPTELVCADPGNRAAAHLGAARMDVFDDPDENVERLKARVGSSASLLIDSGTNVLAASKEFEDSLRDIGIVLSADGYATLGAWVVSTNKIGSVGSAERGMLRMANPFSPLRIFNNRDGSGAMPPNYTPDIIIEHLPPGLVRLVNDAEGFESIITDGIEGYTLSAALICAYVWRFANQDGVRKIFGDDRINSLRTLLNRPTVNVSPFINTNPLKDDCLLELAARAELYRAIAPCGSNIGKAINALETLREKREK